MRRSKTVRAGLVFPVSRIFRYMKKHYVLRGKRISQNAGVYLTAVLEYLTREVTDLAGDITVKARRRLLTPRNIMLAIATDAELHKVTAFAVILPFSGVVPQLQQRSNVFPSSSHPLAPSRGSPRILNCPNFTIPRRIQKPKPPSPLSILSERKIAKQTRLCVLRGSVTSVKGDVVVHPTGGDMGFHGQVGAALLAAGGPHLQHVVREDLAGSGPISLGEVRLTRAVGINCRHLLHCFSPSYNANDAATSVLQLSHVIQRCMTVCDEKGLANVVMPSVGSGNSRFPKQLAAETILRTIKTYCDSHFETTKLSNIYFVLYDQESIDVYTAEMHRLQ